MALPQLSPGVYWLKDRVVTASDGVDIHYTVLPAAGGAADAPAVALLSGFLCPDTWWHFLAPALQQAGYRVVLLHYRGIATSGVPDKLNLTTMSITRYAEDVITALADADIGQVALVGHSMGGQVMTEVASRIPDGVWAVTGVTATWRSPTMNLYGQGWLTGPAASATIGALRLLREPISSVLWNGLWRTMPFLPLTRAAKAFGPDTPAEIIESYEHHAATLTGDLFVAMLEAMHTHQPAPHILSRLTMPALIIGGQHDPFTPTSTAVEFTELLPRATMKILPNTTHAAIVEASTEVNHLILDHLAATR